MNVNTVQEEDESSESSFNKNNDNGLLFAPTCTSFFVQSKYISNADKVYDHTWNYVCLNNTGEYFIFSLGMFHCGYYNNKAKKDVITAQLFAMPSEDIDVPHLPRSCLEGQDLTEGCLDESTMIELRNNLMHNWDTRYSVDKFPPCKRFAGLVLNPTSNQKISKIKFYLVPLIKNFVDIFSNIGYKMFLETNSVEKTLI
jgi:hypothetical protein